MIPAAKVALQTAVSMPLRVTRVVLPSSGSSASPADPPPTASAAHERSGSALPARRRTPDRQPSTLGQTSWKAGRLHQRGISSEARGRLPPFRGGPCPLSSRSLPSPGSPGPTSSPRSNPLASPDALAGARAGSWGRADSPWRCSRWRRRPKPPETAAIGKGAVVSHLMSVRERHQRGEAPQEVERVQDEMGGSLRVRPRPATPPNSGKWFMQISPMPDSDLA
jgi:hypothetical protein